MAHVYDSSFRLPCYVLGALLFFSSFALATEPCRIHIIDKETNWPVPLVELRTTHNVRFVSDNAGNIAFDLSELMGIETWFFVEGHGYQVPEDGFGYRGVKLTPVPGKTLTVTVNRQLSGKRLGRLTGGGLFAESQKLGLKTDWKDQGILGCDSVQTAVHNGQLYWAWGDTTVPGYPLGIFDMLGATTSQQPLKSFEPPLRLRYDYFKNQAEKPRAICDMPGDGPTWMSGFVSLPDYTSTKRLVGTYVKIKPPLEAYESGQCLWSEEHNTFEKHQVLWKKTPDSPQQPLCPDGHPTLWKDEAGKQWVLFGDPFPRLKCEATFEAWSNPDAWQQLTPQRVVISQSENKQIVPHRGSIAWNNYREKWVAIFTQLNGSSSVLGEIWYAEADAPTGPWANAVKVVTHHNYTFYNPRIHPEFTPADSPILLFEGTYTKEFANHAMATPWYDYNQILYRIDLDDAAFNEVRHDGETMNR